MANLLQINNISFIINIDAKAYMNTLVIKQ